MRFYNSLQTLIFLPNILAILIVPGLVKGADPTKTITKILTVTYTPTIEQLQPSSINDLSTSHAIVPNDDVKVLQRVVEFQPTPNEQVSPLLTPAPSPGPALIIVPGLEADSTSGVEVEGEEYEENEDTVNSVNSNFGYDAGYFQSHVEGGQNNLEQFSEKDFHELNNEIDQEEEDDDEGEYEDAFEGENDENIEISSPYHLDPDYRGDQSPKELEKLKPADQTDDIAQPNPTLDQNEPQEHQQPSPDQLELTPQEPEHEYPQGYEKDQKESQLDEDDYSNKYTHSNFTMPKYNDEGHPIPQPIGEHDVEDNEETITKGKQILDTEESNSLLIGNSSSRGFPRRIKGNKLNQFDQESFGSSSLEDDNEDNSLNKTRSRSRFTSTFSRMGDTSDALRNDTKLKLIIVLVGVFSGFMMLA